MIHNGFLPPTTNKSYPAALYTDGGVAGRNPSLLGGSWAYLWVHRDKVIKEESGTITPKQAGTRRITNNYTELLAALLGMESLPDKWAGVIYTDSKVTRTRLYGKGTTKGIPKDIRERLRAVRSRLGHFKVTMVAGHPTKKELKIGHAERNGVMVSIHNVRCDELCNNEISEMLSKQLAGS